MNSRKSILITTAIFIATMFCGNANGQTTLFQINREITKTRNCIDAARKANADAIMYKMQQNANYRYIQENAGGVAELERENDRLLTRAVELIRKKHPGAFVLRTSVLFITYRNVPGVASIGQMYRNNTQRMYEYKHRVAAFEPERQIIKNKCDSAMHAKIDMYQLRLDSLLNRKMELIR